MSTASQAIQAQQTSSTDLAFDRAACVSRVKDALRGRIGADAFTSWFGGLDVESCVDGHACFTVATKFLRSWISTHYHQHLSVAANVGLGALTFDVSVRVAGRPLPVSVKDTTKVPCRGSLQSETGPVIVSPATEEPLASSLVDRRLTFQTFLVNPANERAFLAARSFADGEGSGTLFLHGAPGLGKTHLLQAIATGSGDDGKVLYLTAEKFMYGFVLALRSKSLTEFTARLSGFDTLLVDDVQFLQGASVLVEFRRAVRVMVDGGKRVVLAADRSADKLERLDTDTARRIATGTSFAFDAPDHDLRERMVSARIAEAKERLPSFDVPSEVVSYVAEVVTTNGRDIDGAVNRLVALASFSKESVTVESARDAIKDLVSHRGPKKVRIEDVQRLVAHHYNVTRQDILSERRTAVIVRPRQVAMFISKVTTQRSLPEIGRKFGGKDHTTVLHAVRKIEALVATDKALADEVDMMTRMLTD